MDSQSVLFASESVVCDNFDSTMTNTSCEAIVRMDGAFSSKQCSSDVLHSPCISSMSFAS